MKITIVDDEQHCIDSLVSLLEQIGEEAKSVTIFRDAREAIPGIERYRPDVLFLDVRLQDLTGFHVLQQLSYRGFNLIFTTAYEQYAIDAFRFSAIDYLLKPISRDDLSEAIQKARQQTEQRHLADKLNVLLSHLTPGKASGKISIPTLEGYVFLDMNEIIRCQSDINYTHIFATGGRKYIVSKTLKHFEDLLSAHNFFRIHHSHLINLSHVRKYTKGKGGYVTLSDNTSVEVSSRKKEEFLKICMGK